MDEYNPQDPQEQSIPQEPEDESVFSEERLANLKSVANTEYTAMSEIIKKSEMALTGIVEWLKSAEKNERAFYTASKNYTATLKAIEEENSKPKF